MQKLTPNLRPSAKQTLAYYKLWDRETMYLLFGGGAEGGKSWLGAEWLLTNCYRYPGSKWFIGRNELKRIMQSSYATFRKVCAFHNIPQTDWKFNGQYNYIELLNGSRIDLLDLKLLPTDPMFQRFGSTEYTGGWIEEGGEVNFMAFDVLKTRIGRWKNQELNIPHKILITCNPEQNWLYRIFYKPWKNRTLPKEYAFIQALYKDNPFTKDEAEKRLDQITDPVLRKRLKMGMWEYSADDDSLIDYDSIIDLFSNTIDDEGTSYISADVARYGSDKVTIGQWSGFDLTHIEWKKDRSIPQTAEDIRMIQQEKGIPRSRTVVDDDGVGGGVVDILKGVKGFVGNSSALQRKDKHKVYDKIKDYRKENYKNLRSQCGFMLAEKIVNHEVAISAPIDEPTKEMIIEDLQQLKKKDMPIESPLQLIPKEEVKEALGRSPDFSDMMLMRMIFELEKPTVVHQTDQVGGVLPHYPGIDDISAPTPQPQDNRGKFEQKGGVDWDL